MSDLKEAFVTTNESVWKKVKAKNGRTMHFKDGTPKSQNAFNAATQHQKYKGQPTQIAVPSNKGPGYERKEVSPQLASSIGRELAVKRNKEDPEINTRAQQIITEFEIDGVTYEIDDIADLNKSIVQKHGNEAVMKY